MKPRLIDVSTRLATLETAEKAVRAASSAVGEGFWDVGAFAAVIHSQKLYQDGGFNSWATYCKERLGYSVVTIDNAMKVHETMTRERAGKLGCRLATAIARAPVGERFALVGMADDGEEKKTVERVAKKAAGAERAKLGIVRNQPKRESKTRGKCDVTECDGGVMLKINAPGCTLVVRVRGNKAEWEVV